jgi:hypothetical protein
VTSVRKRLVSVKPSSKRFRLVKPASAVRWWTIASGRAATTRRRERAGIEGLGDDGWAPKSTISRALSALRTSPTTS